MMPSNIGSVSRGRYLVLLDFFWPIGLLIAIGLSWVFLDRLDGAWRWLFVAAALPAFLAYAVRRTPAREPILAGPPRPAHRSRRRTRRHY
jgi:MFS family permease